jgi:hypothetical protein
MKTNFNIISITFLILIFLIVIQSKAIQNDSIMNDLEDEYITTHQHLNELGYSSIPINIPICSQLITHNPQLTTQFDHVSFALSIDPLSDKFPASSPYVAMGNNPINRIDPNGMADEEISTPYHPYNTNDNFIYYCMREDLYNYPDPNKLMDVRSKSLVDMYSSYFSCDNVYADFAVENANFSSVNHQVMLGFLEIYSNFIFNSGFYDSGIELRKSKEEEVSAYLNEIGHTLNKENVQYSLEWEDQNGVNWITSGTIIDNEAYNSRQFLVVTGLKDKMHIEYTGMGNYTFSDITIGKSKTYYTYPLLLFGFGAEWQDIYDYIKYNKTAFLAYKELGIIDESGMVNFNYPFNSPLPRYETIEDTESDNDPND